MPKCPLCVAALLSSFGLGSMLATRLAPHIHSLALTAVALPLAIYALAFMRARRGKRECSCRKAATPPTAALSSASGYTSSNCASRG
jgi:hypothetical protein